MPGSRLSHSLKDWSCDPLVSFRKPCNKEGGRVDGPAPKICLTNRPVPQIVHSYPGSTHCEPNPLCTKKKQPCFKVSMARPNDFVGVQTSDPVKCLACLAVFEQCLIGATNKSCSVWKNGNFHVLLCLDNVMIACLECNTWHPATKRDLWHIISNWISTRMSSIFLSAVGAGRQLPWWSLRCMYQVPFLLIEISVAFMSHINSTLRKPQI